MKDTPLPIHNLTVKNRLVMAPMALNRAAQGAITTDILSYYEARLTSRKVGLLITEHGYVDVAGRASARQISYVAGENSEGIRRLCALAHDYDTPILGQLNHGGSRSKPEGSGPIYGPSAVLNPRSEGNERPEALSREQMDEIVHAFAASARHLETLGYDGVEIHGAHSYLLNQFLSPLTNHRNDDFGGSLENRLRFPLAVTEAVLESVSSKFLIAFRLAACDYRAGGITAEEGILAAKALAEHGVHLLDISGGMGGHDRPSESHPAYGYFQELSAPIQEAVTIPVILTGGVREGHEMESLLEDKRADLIGVGRAIIQDPNWPEKNMA